MERTAYLAGGIFFALAVGIGAFAAHGLEAILEANGRIDTFETGAKYQFYNSAALLIIGSIAGRYKNINFKPVILFFIIGIIIFSGSLYTLSLTNIKIFGAITPIGGLAFILGWIIFILKLRKI